MPKPSYQQIFSFLLTASAVAMGPPVPQFKIDWNRLENIPTLGDLSHILARSVGQQIKAYSAQYSNVLTKHLTSETEVQIVEGVVAEHSGPILKVIEVELGVLQYKARLGEILDSWRNVLLGQPVYPEIHNLLHDRVSGIHEDFEQFIYKIQATSVAKIRAGNKEICRKAFEDKKKILNLTDACIPSNLELAFINGPNMVPNEILPVSEIKRYIETDLIQAAVQYSWVENNIYPLFNNSAGLKIVLEQLASQAPANSKQVQFYTTLYETYQELYKEMVDQLSADHFVGRPDVQNMIPEGTILSTSDKNLGPVLLPIDWYVQQYEVQADIGNHVLTNMSADQCLQLLKKNIEEFRSKLLPGERIELKKYFSYGNF